MRMRNPRRAVWAAFASVTGLMLLTSAAWACTVYRGSFTVTGTTPGSTTQTANGSGSKHGYCSPFTPVRIRSSSPIASSQNYPFQVSTGTSTCSPAVLPDGTYDVNWMGTGLYGIGVNGTEVNQAGDCMDRTRFGVTRLGQVTVSGGQIVGQPVPFAIASPTPVGEGAICISDVNPDGTPKNQNGNQMPFQTI